MNIHTIFHSPVLFLTYIALLSSSFVVANANADANAAVYEEVGLLKRDDTLCFTTPQSSSYCSTIISQYNAWVNVGFDACGYLSRIPTWISYCIDYLDNNPGASSDLTQIHTILSTCSLSNANTVPKCQDGQTGKVTSSLPTLSTTNLDSCPVITDESVCATVCSVAVGYVSYFSCGSSGSSFDFESGDCYLPTCLYCSQSFPAMRLILDADIGVTAECHVAEILNATGGSSENGGSGSGSGSGSSSSSSSSSAASSSGATGTSSGTAGSTASGSSSGSSSAGGSASGGSTNGGSASGGSTNGGSTSAGATGGASSAGSSTPGGSTPGGSTPGGSAGGGSTVGGQTGNSGIGSTVTVQSTNVVTDKSVVTLTAPCSVCITKVVTSTGYSTVVETSGGSLVTVTKPYQTVVTVIESPLPTEYATYTTAIDNCGVCTTTVITKTGYSTVVKPSGTGFVTVTEPYTTSYTQVISPLPTSYATVAYPATASPAATVTGSGSAPSGGSGSNVQTITVTEECHKCATTVITSTGVTTITKTEGTKVVTVTEPCDTTVSLVISPVGTAGGSTTYQYLPGTTSGQYLIVKTTTVTEKCEVCKTSTVVSTGLTTYVTITAGTAYTVIEPCETTYEVVVSPVGTTGYVTTTIISPTPTPTPQQSISVGNTGAGAGTEVVVGSTSTKTIVILTGTTVVTETKGTETVVVTKPLQTTQTVVVVVSSGVTGGIISTVVTPVASEGPIATPVAPIASIKTESVASASSIPVVSSTGPSAPVASSSAPVQSPPVVGSEPNISPAPSAGFSESSLATPVATNSNSGSTGSNNSGVVQVTSTSVVSSSETLEQVNSGSKLAVTSFILSALFGTFGIILLI